ncbi:MAG: PAS domain S-box protein [Proteobacteria bacterium]|nr:PAS domain S-box protein [Pseudomonadota bacterium]
MAKKTSDLSLGRILIVDDEQELMSVLCETLAGKGYETLGFTSGEKALDVLKNQDFDILLTDLMMPGMDGIALFKAALEIDHNIISIIMTGQGTVQTAVKAMQFGAFDYILKPFKINFLLPLIARAMEVRWLKLENIQLQETVAIYELATLISFPFDIRTILNKLLDAAIQQCQSDEASIMLPAEDDKSELYIALAKGKHLEQFIGTRVPIDSGIAGWVARNHQLVTLDGKVEDARFKPVNPRDDIHSAASMPILAGGKLLGVLNVSTTQSRRAFTLGQIKGLSILVSIIAPVLESSWLYDQIRLAEEKYRSIFTNAIEGILQISPEGRFITANPALARMYGYDTPEELIATVKSIEEELYIRPEERDKFKHLLYEKSVVENFEAEMRRKDGTTFWVSMNARAILNKEGETLYHEGTSEDITQRKEAENILKLYKLLSENTRDIILFIRFRDGRIIEANQAAEDAYGYTHEELQSLTIFNLREPDSQAVVTEEMKKASEKNIFYETVHRRKDGTTFFVESSSQGIVVRDEKVLLNIIRDVTERKKAEERIVAEKQRFLSLVDNAPFGLIMVDQDGNFQYFNSKFEEMFGYTLYDTPNGKTWFKQAYPDPAYRHSVISTWKADIEKLKAGENITETFEVTCKDGSIKVVNFIPVQMESGQFLMACEDITVRKQAEESLRQAETKYRSIFENAVEGIFQTTLNGRFLSTNPAMARMSGYDSPEEFMSSVTNIGEQLYVNPDDYVRYITLMKEKGRVEGFEVQHYRKDRSIFWASINAHAVKDETGNILNFEGTFEDITLRKLAEEELKQTLEKLRKTLAGTIQAMSLIVETRDPYTSGHQKRVSNLAIIIAQEMNLSKDTIENIRTAGNIHDIGKISVPAEILSKPTKLSNMEFGLIKVHPQTGYDILKEVGLPHTIAETVLQHHERLDGSGYPQGLKGENIILEARILAVADVIEAMASHRPYRPAKGIDAALEEIEKNKGILYDNEVADVCIRLFREKGFTF